VVKEGDEVEAKVWMWTAASGKSVLHEGLMPGLWKRPCET
jgi:hypothetical protein